MHVSGSDLPNRVRKARNRNIILALAKRQHTALIYLILCELTLTIGIYQASKSLAGSTLGYVAPWTCGIGRS